MKRLILVTMAMGSFSVVNVMVGFVRAKSSALLLGPEGVGLLSQASAFLLLGITVCSLNSNTGITKRISEAWALRDTQRLRDLLDTTFQLLCLTGLAAAGILVFALGPAARLLLGEVRWAPALLGVAVALPLDVVTATLWQAILLGADRYDLYTRASIAATVAGLAPFLLMMYLWGVEGAILSIGVAAFFRQGVFLYYALPVVDWRPRITGVLSREILGSLVGYSAAMLLVAAFLEMTVLGIRTGILRYLGPAANGVFQVPVALSAYYSVFFTNGLWGHFYPRMSRRVSPRERLAELNSAVRFITLGITVLAVALIVVRKPLIVLLYSSRFNGAANLIPFYAAGDIFFLISMVYTVSLLSLPRLKAYVVIWGIFCLLRVAFSWFLIMSWGLVGAAVAYAASTAALLMGCVVYHARGLGLLPTGQNLRLIASAAVLVVVPILLPLSWAVQTAVYLALTCLWLLAVISAEEWRMGGRLLKDVLHGSLQGVFQESDGVASKQG